MTRFVAVSVSYLVDSTAELLLDVTWSSGTDVTCDDVWVRSVETVDLCDSSRAGGRNDVGGRRIGVAGRRRHLGDTDESACGRDAVRQAAWCPRDTVEPSTATRRRLPRTSVRVAAGRATAVHASDRNDRALERSPCCFALQACLSAAITAAVWTPPLRGTSTPSR